MTTTHRLKLALIDYLEEEKPDEGIIVSDAKSRAEIAPPLIAVDITGVEQHSVALGGVQRCEVQITLRTHTGDDDEELETWIDQIESALCDTAAVKDATDADIRIDHWLYIGSSQEWDESMLETTFSAECLVARV